MEFNIQRNCITDGYAPVQQQQLHVSSCALVDKHIKANITPMPTVFARVSTKARLALACETVNVIMASTTIQTGCAGTVVI